MLGVNQLDFINYCNALKGNYRKGVHKMETLLENPTHAKEFANNLGGVSVVLGTPVGKRKTATVKRCAPCCWPATWRTMPSTWMGQFYEFSSWDDLLSDASRCNEIMNDPLKSRAVSGSGVAVGKMVATIAGLSCSAYADMSAVAASSTAMAAIASDAMPCRPRPLGGYRKLAAQVAPPEDRRTHRSIRHGNCESMLSALPV